MPKIVVAAAASGSVAALDRIFFGLGHPCTVAILVVLHVGSLPSLLPQILRRVTSLSVAHALDGEPIEAGHIYVAPPDLHMLVLPGRIGLSRGPKVNQTQPAADPLFMSAAAAYGKNVVGIVLTGWDSDGADGLRRIKEWGGCAIVQYPGEAVAPVMPRSAIARDHPDLCLSLDGIAAKLRNFCAADKI